MSYVAVYNAGGTETVQYVSPKHARKMLYRNVARVLNVLENGRIAAVELLKYIFPKWKYDNKAKHYSKRGVLERDKYICAYDSCTIRATTIDHILPKSLGGQSTWENCVACCVYHNQKKGNKTLAESGLKLVNKPYVP